MSATRTSDHPQKNSDVLASETPSPKVPIWAVMVIVLVIALFGAGTIYIISDQIERQKLLVEFAKVLMQLAAVGVVAAVVKAFLDNAQERRSRANQLLDQAQERADQLRDQAQERAEAARERERLRQAWLADFRSDKLKRLVAATNRVRTARLLIPAHGSARTYGEQMRELLDTALEIRLIEHETEALGGDRHNPAFPDWPDLRAKLQGLRKYLEQLHLEFQEHYEDLAEQQRLAENASGTGRGPLRSEIRQKIENLPRIKRLLAEGPSAEEDERGFYRLYLFPYHDAVTQMVKNTARDRLPEVEQQALPTSRLPEADKGYTC
jgi:hypothetical protein